MANRRDKREQKKKDNKTRRQQLQKRQRNKKILNYSLLAVVLVALGYAGFVYFSTEETGEHDELARCLTRAGTIMYGTDWCPYCQEQKRTFGSSFKYVTYVNCDISAEACDLAGVSGYPTWVFPDGSSTSGIQTLEYLAEKSQCT